MPIQPVMRGDEKFLEILYNSWLKIMRDKEVKELKRTRFNRELSRFFVRVLSQICGADLTRDELWDFGGYNQDYYRVKYNNRARKVSKVSLAFQILFFLTTISLSFYCALVYIQISFEANLESHSSSAGIDNSTYLVHLKNKPNYSGQLLDAFGDPFINIHRIVIANIIYLILITSTIFLIPNSFQIIFNDTLDLMNVRMFIDEKLFIKYYCRLTMKELNNYITSGENFLRFGGKKRGKESRQEFNCRSEEFFQNATKFEYIIESLKEMCLNGDLQPFNRRLEWIDKIRPAFNAIIIVVLINVSVMVITYWIVICSTRGCRLRLNDILIFIQVIWLSLATIIGAGFYVSAFATNIFDYIFLTIKIDRTIKICNETNRSKFYYVTCTKFTQSEARKAEILADLNTNILYILMHYKIFIRQLKLSQRTFQLYAAALTLVQVCAPLTLLVQLPSLSKDMRAIFIVPFVAYAIICSSCLAPICYLNNRCSRLFNSMFNLRAHIAEVEHLLGNNQNIYDKHAIILFHKELIHSAYLTNQYAIRAFGFTYNVPGFFRISFYTILLFTFSILSESNSRFNKTPRFFLFN